MKVDEVVTGMIGSVSTSFPIRDPNTKTFVCCIAQGSIVFLLSIADIGEFGRVKILTDAGIFCCFYDQAKMHLDIVAS